MKNRTKRIYDKAVRDLSHTEIAESLLVSDTTPISKKEHNEFLRKRLELLNNRTKDELTISNLLQLKYEVETYIELDEYDPSYSFAKCLKRYMQIMNKSSKDLTEELSIHKTRLSRILNNKEEANTILSYKLEKHSGQLLPALFWWKLIAMKKNHEIVTNKKDRKEASVKVKSAVQRKVYG